MYKQQYTAFSILNFNKTKYMFIWRVLGKIPPGKRSPPEKLPMENFLLEKNPRKFTPEEKCPQKIAPWKVPRRKIALHYTLCSFPLKRTNDGTLRSFKIVHCGLKYRSVKLFFIILPSSAENEPNRFPTLPPRSLICE